MMKGIWTVPARDICFHSAFDVRMYEDLSRIRKEAAKGEPFLFRGHIFKGEPGLLDAINLCMMERILFKYDNPQNVQPWWYDEWYDFDKTVKLYQKATELKDGLKRLPILDLSQEQFMSLTAEQLVKVYWDICPFTNPRRLGKCTFRSLLEPETRKAFWREITWLKRAVG
jgi:hypothetical protein